MNKYRNLLVSVDGLDHVTDNEAETVAEVWEKCGDMGSRWIFYPISFVVKNNRQLTGSRIIDTCAGLSFLKGKSVKTAFTFIKNNQDYINSLFS